MNWEEISLCIENNTPLFWNDPDYIKDSDYKISFIETLEDEPDFHTPILIKYNGGLSKAQVFLHEIIK